MMPPKGKSTKTLQRAGEEGVSPGGMMKLWIFLGGHRKTGLFLGVIAKYSRAFS